MTTTANRLQRTNILGVASKITATPKTSEAVLLAAAPLTAWVEEAENVDGVRSRIAALLQHGINMDRENVPSVEEFLAGARELHGFLALGEESEHLI